MSEYDTSIPLKKKFFEKIKSFDKTVHIDKSLHGLETYPPGQFVRFMNGYNPDNGSVIRRVKLLKEVKVGHLTLCQLDMACINQEWIENYADLSDSVYLYFLQEDEEDK